MPPPAIETKYRENLNRLQSQAKAKAQEDQEKEKKEGGSSFSNKETPDTSSYLFFAFMMLILFDMPKLFLTYAALIPLMQWVYFLAQFWGFLGRIIVMLWMVTKGIPIFGKSFFGSMVFDVLGLPGLSGFIIMLIVQQKTEQKIGSIL